MSTYCGRFPDTRYSTTSSAKQAAHADDGLSRHDQEALDLRRVIVVAARGARHGGGQETLSLALALHRLVERPALVGLELKRPRVAPGEEERAIGVEKLQVERRGQRRHPMPGVGAGHPVEPREKGAHRQAHPAHAALASRRPGSDLENLLRGALRVHEVELLVLDDARALAACDLVAERGHDGVVVRAPAFAEHVGQDEIGEDSPGAGRPVRDQLRRDALRAAVGRIERLVRGGGENDVRPRPGRLERGDEPAGERDVRRFDDGVRAAVQSRKVHDGAALPGEARQRVVVVEHPPRRERRALPPVRVQRAAQVPAQEAVTSRDADCRHCARPPSAAPFRARIPAPRGSPAA